MQNINKRILILATLAIFICASLVNIFPVSALDEGCQIIDPNDPATCLCWIPEEDNPKNCMDHYFSSNDITYHNPYDKSCEVKTSASMETITKGLVGNENAEKIFTALVAKGLSGEQAAGILGNLKEESGFDPAVEQGGRIVDENYPLIPNVGFGIAQWTHPSRQAELNKYKVETSRTIIDLSMQIDFLWKELTATPALATLKAQTTPEAAARDFHTSFEKSADTEAGIQERERAARALFDKYKSLGPATADANSPCVSSPGSGLSNFLDDKFTIYNQCQYPPYGGAWGERLTPYGGTMCQNACVPTALAMISKNMVGLNVTPNETIDYYTKNNLWYPGGGSFNTSPLASAEAFGLTVSKIDNKGDIAAYKAVFDKGGMIMALSAGSLPFLPSRHAVVLRGITPEGNFKVADPGRTETNKEPANEPSTDKILTDIRSDGASVVYAFYKK